MSDKTLVVICVSVAIITIGFICVVALLTL